MRFLRLLVPAAFLLAACTSAEVPVNQTACDAAQTSVADAFAVINMCGGTSVDPDLAFVRDMMDAGRIDSPPATVYRAVNDALGAVAE